MNGSSRKALAGALALAAAALAGCGDERETPAASAAPAANPAVVQVQAPAAAPEGNWRALDDSARAELRALATGSMARLIVHPETRPFWEKGFASEAGEPLDLTHFRGRVTLLNFWATWCAPCRKEMPDLDGLERDLGGADFHVAPLSLDRGEAVAKVRDFYQEVGLTDLPIYLDPRSTLAKEFAVLALPVTVLLDREGREVARLTGDAEWHSPEAQAAIRHLIAATAPAP